MLPLASQLPGRVAKLEKMGERHRKIWENHGRLWEDMGKIWENDGKIWENDGETWSKVESPLRWCWCEWSNSWRKHGVGMRQVGYSPRVARFPCSFNIHKYSQAIPSVGDLNPSCRAALKPVAVPISALCSFLRTSQGQGSRKPPQTSPLGG